MSQLKVDNITDELGTGAPNFPNGIANGFLPKGAPIYITTSGTYTPSAGTRAVLIKVLGGGGGGAAVGAAGSTAIAGGGGAGGYTERFDIDLPASYNVVVGSGGLGVQSSNGQSGGQSSVTATGKTDLLANGGSGAGSRPASSGQILNSPGGLGGVSSGGDINILGGRGRPGMSSTTGSNFGPFNQADGGTPAFFGLGGNAPTHSGGNDRRDSGSGGNGFGSGGSGGAVTNANVDRPGGNGAQGLVVIQEFE